jgi:predicted permease
MILPLSGGGYGGTFTSNLAAEVGEEERRRADVRVVTRDYFRVMGIPILRGRSFEPADRRDGRRVLVVSQEFSQRFWPLSGAVGKVLQFGVRPGPDGIEGEVVGIVGDVRAAGLHREPAPTVYAVAPQVATSEMTIVVRTAQPTASLMPAVRSLLAGRDPDIVVDQVTTLPDLLSNSLGRPRFVMELLALFAGLAVTLAVVGIYGVVSYAVAERSREIGVRMALGADPRRVTGTVLLQELRWAVAGLAAGSVTTIAAVPLLASAVYGLDPGSPLFQLMAAIGLLAVATIACLVPARRAARVDPLMAIRAD